MKCIYPPGTCAWCRDHRKCSARKCDSPLRARGLCEKHYRRLTRSRNFCRRCLNTTRLRARGLCGSCYTYTARTERRGKNKRATGSYWQDVVEYIDYHYPSWSDLEREFGRNRATLANLLRQHGLKNVIALVDEFSGGAPKVGRPKKYAD